jgi:hypothetical protein
MAVLVALLRVLEAFDKVMTIAFAFCYYYEGSKSFDGPGRLRWLSIWFHSGNF